MPVLMNILMQLQVESDDHLVKLSQNPVELYKLGAALVAQARAIYPAVAASQRGYVPEGATAAADSFDRSDEDTTFPSFIPG